MNILEKSLEEIENESKLTHEEMRRCASENSLQFDEAKGYARGVEYVAEIIRSHMDDAATTNDDGKIEAINKEMEEYLFEKYCIEGFDEELDKIFQKYLAIGKNMKVSSNNDWIPVGERLPEPNKKVFVTVEHSSWIADFDSEWVSEKEKTHHPETSSTYLGYINENSNWIFIDEEGQENICNETLGTNRGRIYDVVTYWQLLPEPYKPKELKTEEKPVQ